MLSKYSNQINEIKEEEIQEAADEIIKGNLVLFPTETVYGIGAISGLTIFKNCCIEELFEP